MQRHIPRLLWHSAQHSTYWLLLPPFILKKTSSCCSRFRIWGWQELRELRSRRPLEHDGEGERNIFHMACFQIGMLIRITWRASKNDLGFIPDLQKSESLRTRPGTLYLNMFPRWVVQVCEPPSQTCPFPLLACLICIFHSQLSLGARFFSLVKFMYLFF